MRPQPAALGPWPSRPLGRGGLFCIRGPNASGATRPASPLGFAFKLGSGPSLAREGELQLGLADQVAGGNAGRPPGLLCTLCKTRPPSERGVSGAFPRAGSEAASACPASAPRPHLGAAPGRAGSQAWAPCRALSPPPRAGAALPSAHTCCLRLTDSPSPSRRSSLPAQPLPSPDHAPAPDAAGIPGGFLVQLIVQIRNKPAKMEFQISYSGQRSPSSQTTHHLRPWNPR